MPNVHRDTLRIGSFPQLMSARYDASSGLPEGAVVSLGIHGGRIYAAGECGSVSAFEGGRWRPADAQDLPPVPTLDLSAAALVAASGLRVRHTIADNAGVTWIATDRGVVIADRTGRWRLLDRHCGVPYEDTTCLAFAPNGDLWGGASEGAWRLRGGDWRYFWGKRWLSGNRVYCIQPADDGSVWIGADGGVSRIWEEEIDLAAKAVHYEEITALRHNRRGWVTTCRLNTPGVTYVADDNDGLWTSMYVAAEAFRYAVTRDPEARDLCTKSMRAILDLVHLSGYPGFPARTMILDGEAVEGYDPDETVRFEGASEKIWYRSPLDPAVLCKGDTSSDELNGHYFAWYLYHDLVADEHEKAELREVVAAVTDNLLRNGYSLVGHTGKPTRWAVFGPAQLNDDPGWAEERALNSTSLLCFLKVAEHICGDRRYAEARDDLIANHGYLANTIGYRSGWPWYMINHSDDELAFLAYYPLLMLEDDPRRRAMVAQAMARCWQELRDERPSLYSFIYGAATGLACDVENAVDTLRDWPWELIQWDVRNSHRHDVGLRTSPGGHRTQLDRVLPASERRVWRWNANPWIPDDGRAGATEEDAAAWLLPYWMGRYHKIIDTCS